MLRSIISISIGATIQSSVSISNGIKDGGIADGTLDGSTDGNMILDGTAADFGYLNTSARGNKKREDGKDVENPTRNIKLLFNI
jgi:hypothetical protein